MLWDYLPEDLLDIIYKKIVYKQPKNLQNDLISYVNTIKQIENNNHNNIIISNTDWDILWFLVLLYYKKDNIEKEKHFNYMKKYVLNNNDLMMRFEGAMYWIKKYIRNLSIKDRENFICSIKKY
jgi:hypothetical protein